MQCERGSFWCSAGGDRLVPVSCLVLSPVTWWGLVRGRVSPVFRGSAACLESNYALACRRCLLLMGICSGFESFLAFPMRGSCRAVPGRGIGSGRLLGGGAGRGEGGWAAFGQASPARFLVLSFLITHFLFFDRFLFLVSGGTCGACRVTPCS